MFIFHAIIPALCPFWRKFYWLSTFIFSMPESQSRKNKKVIKMERLKRWWYLSKRNLIMTLLLMAICTVLLEKLYTVLR